MPRSIGAIPWKPPGSQRCTHVSLVLKALSSSGFLKLYNLHLSIQYSCYCLSFQWNLIVAVNLTGVQRKYKNGNEVEDLGYAGVRDQLNYMNRAQRPAYLDTFFYHTYRQSSTSGSICALGYEMRRSVSVL